LVPTAAAAIPSPEPEALGSDEPLDVGSISADETQEAEMLVGEEEPMDEALELEARGEGTSREVWAALAPSYTPPSNSDTGRATS
jgi:hypothetical protein